MTATFKNALGTTSWYLQDGNESRSGIWIRSYDNQLLGIEHRDSIVVTGIVQERHGVTTLDSVSSVIVYSQGNTEPLPLHLSTGSFSYSANNYISAEPYEGMLVTFTRPVVTNVYPYFSDQTMYTVDDGSGPIFVRQDGNNSYSNIPEDTGKIILRVGDTISTLTGIIFQNETMYSLVPRKNSDFGQINSVTIKCQLIQGWNMISLPVNGINFPKDSIFTNSVSHSFYFQAPEGYIIHDSLSHGYGMWLKFPTNDAAVVTGTRLNIDSITVTEGWNLIGSLSYEIPASTIEAIGTTIISPFFGYNNSGYFVSSVIEPGKAYWVKVDQTGKIILRPETLTIKTKNKNNDQ